MKKYVKLVTFLCVLAGSILLMPLMMVIPPIGMLFLLIAPIAFFALPFMWLACLVLWIILEKNKTIILPIVLLCAIAISFKFGALWLFWALVFIMNVIAILLIIKWWERHRNIFLKLLFAILIILIATNLLATFNPFASFFGFFGAEKLIALNAEMGNPCNACQNEKWQCGQLNNSENTCDDLKNIKNCYCCECIKNLKFCNDCFFFWNNNYQCDFITNKCNVGW